MFKRPFIMSLWRKLIFKDAAVLLSVLILVGACLWGLLLQRRQVRASLREYEAVRYVEAATSEVIAFRHGLSVSNSVDGKTTGNLQEAYANMRRYKALLTQYDAILPGNISQDRQALARVKTKTIVNEMTELVRALSSTSSTENHAQLLERADALVQEMAELLTVCNEFLSHAQLASDQDLHASIIQVAVVASLIVAIVMFSSIWHYRRMMLPLHRLRFWCRQAASGNFPLAYTPSSDLEFRELAADVNKMAAELNTFYRRLQEMVESKSRELVRSERLASVGYLAAGVAHEINSPLNIISGYAELSTKRLLKPGSDSEKSNVLESLGIIRSEAFRCKEITTKLLSLARGGAEARETINIVDAVNDVANLVRGLRDFRGKTLVLPNEADETIYVEVNPTEIKQVLLNLIVNALEAAPPISGTIQITIAVENEMLELAVIDNGRGMDAETIPHVFEPFFTNKRGAGEPGTGLGLSITHGIVLRHGGTISAQSDGPGRGSRFVIRLPLNHKAIAAAEEAKQEVLT